MSGIRETYKSRKMFLENNIQPYFRNPGLFIEYSTLNLVFYFDRRIRYINKAILKQSSKEADPRIQNICLEVTVFYYRQSMELISLDKDYKKILHSTTSNPEFTFMSLSEIFLSSACEELRPRSHLCLVKLVRLRLFGSLRFSSTK